MSGRAEEKQGSILYVEDDHLLRTVIMNALKRRYPEFILLGAGNGEEGLALFRSNKPDIVITDIEMPIMDGVRMATAIAAISANPRIIVTSGSADKKQIFDSIGLDTDCFIGKPIARPKLFAAIDHHIEGLNRPSSR